jgi:MtN3 and saliva related transmembrane protein
MDFSRLLDLIGLAGAVLTTLCWLPQVMKAVRDKETRALSLSAPRGLPAGSGSG